MAGESFRSGLPPPALPNIKFTGPSGVVDPRTQPAVGIALAALNRRLGRIEQALGTSVAGEQEEPVS